MDCRILLLVAGKQMSNSSMISHMLLEYIYVKTKDAANTATRATNCIQDVQSYNKDGWYFMTELHKFVNNGMVDMSFIDAISGIVNRGCHNPRK